MPSPLISTGDLATERLCNDTTDSDEYDTPPAMEPDPIDLYKRERELYRQRGYHMPLGGQNH